MPVYYAIGDALVSPDEWAEKRATGQLTTFAAALTDEKATPRLEFTTGVAERGNVGRVAATDQNVTPFVPIGLGKPLTIEARHVYTGRYPEPGWVLDRPKDLLFNSAVKTPVVNAPAPRAINLLRTRVPRKSNIEGPAATEEGTALVYYSPALTQPSLIVTLEFLFDQFPQQAFTTVGTALKVGAGIPVFAPASAYMLAAGMVIDIAGRIGERLFDGTLAFRATENLAFDRPGSQVPVADFRLVTAESFDDALLTTHAVRGGKLVHKQTGAVYAGDFPYTVISLDGRENKAYETFQPTALSAVLLERFYHVGGSGQPLDLLLDAVKVFNDFQFYQQAKEAKARRDLIADATSAEYKKADTEYKALLKNVLTKDFKDLGG